MPETSTSADEIPRGDLIDESGGKAMGPGGGGGGYYDPSYEDALRILGREYELPSPMAQRAFTMTDAEAAELADRLTSLRKDGMMSAAEQPIGEFIAGLQARPPDVQKLSALREQIAQFGPGLQADVERVWQFPGVQAQLAAAA